MLQQAAHTVVSLTVTTITLLSCCGSSVQCSLQRQHHGQMEAAASHPLLPLRCSSDTCPVARVIPSATYPLTHDDTSLAWHACTSIAHICHLQLHYYHNHLLFTPTYNGALHSETQPILTSLADVTSSGLFVPTFSQPAVAEDEYNCYHVRSGCPQRAALSGWTNDVGVKRLQAEWQRELREAEARTTVYREQAEAESVDLHICITPPSNPSHQLPQPTSYCLHPPHLPCQVAISRTANTATRPSIRQRLGLPQLHSSQLHESNHSVTSVGGGDTRRGKELEDWRRQLSGGGRRCVESEGWMVWLVDEQWGRKQRLWQFLLHALTVER